MCTYLQMKGSRICYPIINTLAYIILCIFYKRGPMSKHFSFPKHRINFTYLFVHYLLGWSDTTLFVILENRHMLLIKYTIISPIPKNQRIWMQRTRGAHAAKFSFFLITGTLKMNIFSENLQILNFYFKQQ